MTLTMRGLFLFFALYLAHAYQATDNKDNSVQKDSSEESEEWLHAPPTYESDEFDWADEWPVSSEKPGPISETYQWLDDDIIQKMKHSEETRELITLPGGCELTKTQYQKLKDFKNDVHYVQKCFCREGAVYCKLKKNADHVQIT